MKIIKRIFSIRNIYSSGEKIKIIELFGLKIKLYKKNKNIDNFTNCKKIYIITPPHTEFIAKCIYNIFNTYKIKSKVMFNYEKYTKNTLYLIISPNYFDKLPKNYFAFNVEQSISNRWFTQDYFAKLTCSYGILDYSLKNIDFLKKNNINKERIFYAKLSPLPCINFNIENKIQDILFYGDTSCKRRKEILNKLKNKYNIKVVDNSFHNDIINELNKSKIILNIHYYEGAMLETTRICEALSHGCMVISERGVNNEEYPELEELVDFVNADDIEAIEHRIQYWMSNQDLLNEKIKKNNEIIEKSFKSFNFFISRFLLYYNIIDFELFYKNLHDFFDLKDKKVCIGMPESIERAKYFKSINKYGFKVFPAIKFPIGWIGCGMSYKFISRKALEEKIDNLIICEDDVEFLPDFKERFKVAEEYFFKNNIDLFSGFIVDLHKDAIIYNIKKYKEVEFITVNKMTSCVFCHYGKRILEKIALWDEKNKDESNTIDRYLENCTDLKISFAFPFLVGHNDNLFSTLWNFKNDKYNKLLESTIDKINKKKKEYLEQKNYTYK